MQNEKIPYEDILGISGIIDQFRPLVKTKSRAYNARRKHPKILALRKELKRLGIAYNWFLYGWLTISKIPGIRNSITIHVMQFPVPGSSYDQEYFICCLNMSDKTLEVPATTATELLIKLVRYEFLLPTEIFNRKSK